MANKHQAMYEYILQNETIQKLFYLTNEAQDNSVTITPVYSDEVIKQYIDGTAERQYDFAVALYKNLSDVPFDMENLVSMTEAQSFMDWIDAQDAAGNFPDFGQACTVTKIRNLQDMPGVAGEDGKHIKYLFQCRVEYTEKRKGGI